MSDDDRGPADVLLSSMENGDPRINVGSNSDGVGFGADTGLWANGTAFIALPAAADSARCAQVIVEQDGDVKRAVASRDNRYSSKAGTLAPGDAAIVSPGSAYFKLTTAANDVKIEGDTIGLAATIGGKPAARQDDTAGRLAFDPAGGGVGIGILYYSPSQTAPYLPVAVTTGPPLPVFPGTSIKIDSGSAKVTIG